MKKILLFSSICKPKEILEVSLPSYLALNAKGFEIDFLFYDDNTEKDSSEYLDNLTDVYDNVIVQRNWLNTTSNYRKHDWNKDQVLRIIEIKNKALEICLLKSYDYVFLVDSDLTLHPDLLQHLVGLKKDFVFELFWTLFTGAAFVKPNCWDKHSWAYNSPNTILQLKTPGTYKVGAGGACTLVSSRALKSGLSFKLIENLPYGGEDRHFCTRAEVLGFDIFIDTHLPAYHIYVKSDIKKAKKWYSDGAKSQYFDAWLDESWVINIKQMFKVSSPKVPKNMFQLYKYAFYKGKRAFINYLRFNHISKDA